MCNQDVACDVDCVQTQGAWSQCTADCGGGTKSRTNPVSVPQSGNGAACPYALTETNVACNTQACPRDCVGTLTQGTTCSNPKCGGTGYYTDVYNIQPGQDKVGTGAACPYANGDVFTNRSCVNNSPGCVQDCVGGWTNGTTCSTNACGASGNYTDTYHITTPAANGGAACPYSEGATKTDRSCSAPAAGTGAGSCDRNCVGSWVTGSTCDVNGCGATGHLTDRYTIPSNTAKSGNGTACPNADGDTRQSSTTCSPPVATCDQDCQGYTQDDTSWETDWRGWSSAIIFTKTWKQTQAKKGTGSACPYSANQQYRTCVYDPGSGYTWSGCQPDCYDYGQWHLNTARSTGGGVCPTWSGIIYDQAWMTPCCE